jgi:ribonuclease HI
MARGEPPLVRAVFADGGVVGRNPSPLGGVYAWRHVDADNLPLAQESGVVPAGATRVTNNQAEFYALLRALEALPAGWSGLVGSDSRVTLGRFFESWKLDGIPVAWARRLGLALARIDAERCQVVLLDGHPTREQLRRGRGRRGHPVSVHQDWCDRECRRQASHLLAAATTGACEHGAKTKDH